MVLQGNDWKTMRGALSPTFTTGKLKSVIPTINKCHEEFNQFIYNKMVKEGDVFEMHSLFNR